MSAGDEDAGTTVSHLHHTAGALPDGQAGRGPVHAIHLRERKQILVDLFQVMLEKIKLKMSEQREEGGLLKNVYICCNAGPVYYYKCV